MDEKLITSGAGVNLMGLRQQYPQHVQLGRLYEKQLARAGWKPDMTDELELYGLELDTAKSAKLEARTESRIKAMTEAEARTEAKRIIRLVRNALPDVLEELDASEAAALKQDFKVGEPINRSTPRAVAYLVKTQKAVKRLDEAFRPYFDEKSVYAMHSAILDRLSSADAEQEFARAQLPADTRAFYELKGRVLKLILKMNRLAKNAFDGQAHIIGQFNKDLLLRATRNKTMPAVEEAVDESTPADAEVVAG